MLHQRFEFESINLLSSLNKKLLALKRRLHLFRHLGHERLIGKSGRELAHHLANHRTGKVAHCKVPQFTQQLLIPRLASIDLEHDF